MQFTNTETKLLKSLVERSNGCHGIDGNAHTVYNDPDVGHEYTYSLTPRIDKVLHKLVKATKSGERTGRVLVSSNADAMTYLVWRTTSMDTLWNIRLTFEQEAW